uniref:ornithine decarboxylase n=1 Tax=Plectus sambesii TaxID=2011161 RepID=A0A914V0E2_9BILA
MDNVSIASELPLRTELYSNHALTVFTDHRSPVDIAKDVACLKSAQGDDLPFMVMDAGRVMAQMAEWRRLLPRVEPFYAVKCNNDPVLMRLLADQGAGFDCASKGEIDQILEHGLAPPEKIIYANPCKTRNYIKHAARCQVNMMTFDCEDELHKVKSFHPHAQMILRIAVSDPTAQCPLNIKFGCDPIQAGPALLAAAAELSVDVVGISFHVGSGCNDPTAYAVAIGHARRLFDLGDSLGHQMTILDLGGGYPGHPTENITFPQIAGVINGALDEYFPEVGYNAVRVIGEPGRFFASAAFTLVTNVIAKTKVPASRITQNEHDATTDGFMYYLNDGVYGSFNCILYDHNRPTGRPLFERPEDTDASRQTWAALWGPTCDGLDQITSKCRLRRLNEGDWVAWDNMGAYTCAAGSEFNGFPRPNIYYFIADKEWQALREQSLSSPDGQEDEIRSVASSFSSCSGFDSAFGDEYDNFVY